jgi:hypothetical protein
MLNDLTALETTAAAAGKEAEVVDKAAEQKKAPNHRSQPPNQEGTAYGENHHKNE